MEYAVELCLQGGDLVLPIAERVLLEMGEMRDGPGEEEMERLMAAVTPLLAVVLQQLDGMSEDATLNMALEGDTTHLRLDLRLVAPGSAADALPAALVTPLLPSLEQAFDRVEGPDADVGEPFHLVLIRHPSS